METTGKLICAITGRKMKVGEEVVSFRGEMYTLVGWDAPKREGSSGRVYVKDATGEVQEYFPSVFEAKFDN